MAESFGAQNTSGGATLSASPKAATTAGDLLVAVIRDRNTSASVPVASVTDSTGETWSHAASVTQGTQADGEIWYVANAASLSTSQAVKVTVGGTSASTSAMAFTVLDVTGASSSPLDVTATKGGSTQPASTGTTATTAQASEIAIGDIGWNSSVTPSGQTAGYTTTAVQQSTVSGSAAGEQAAWRLLTATGAQSYSATLSSSMGAWTGTIATFKVGASPAMPTITNFSPTSGAPGASVTINGSGFTGASSVAFNGAAAPYTVTDDLDISTSVPAGATTGPITVTAAGGTATSALSFTVNPPPVPTITDFSPTSQSEGNPVAITGSGFTGASAVAFNGTSATYSVTDDSFISTSVPAGATTGTITVTSLGGTVTSSASFTVARTYVTNVTVAIAKGTVLSLGGTFTESITATSVGSTVAWKAYYNGDCVPAIYFGRFTGGNTFTHNFAAPRNGGCPVFYEMVPIDAGGNAGAPGYSQADSLDTEVYDDSTFSLDAGTWALICGPQYYGGCLEHSSSGLGTQASYQAYGSTNFYPYIRYDYSIGIVGSTGPQGGIAAVYVNNVYHGQISFYTSTVTYRHVLFAYGVAPSASADPTLQTVRIVVIAKGANGGYNMNLDAAIENACCGD